MSSVGITSMGSTRQLDNLHAFRGPDLISDEPVAISVPQIAKDRRARSIGILADSHFENSETVLALISALAERNISNSLVIHDGREPSVQSVADYADEFQAIPDLLIAIGGGSVMDTAKAIAIHQSTTSSLQSYEGEGMISTKLTPIVAIPTTAGTGSEVTGSCVLLSTDGARKISIRSPQLRPVAVVLDAALLRGAPRSVIRSSGVDALGHAIESYFSTRSTPLTQALSLASVRLLNRHLIPFYQDPTDQSASFHMGWAASIAGIAFNSARVGLGHALAAVVAPIAGVPHGIAVGVALPHHLRNCDEAREGSWSELAHALSLTSSTEEDAKHSVQVAVDEMLKALEVPGSLAEIPQEVHFTEQDAKNVLASGRIATHPANLEIEMIQQILQEIAGTK